MSDLILRLVLQSVIVTAFSHRHFLILMIALIITISIDVSFIKIYDLLAKNLVPIQSKLILFAVNSSLCLLLQFFAINYTWKYLKTKRLNKILKLSHIISLSALGLIGISIGLTMIQQFYDSQYDRSISILIIIISYGAASVFLISLSLSFLSWYRSNRNFIVLLYFVSMILISFNLVITATFTSAKMSYLPSHIREQVTGSSDFVSERLRWLDSTYRISSIMSFLSIWITSTILMNYYREKLIRSIVYWIILSIPLVYFLITYFFQFIVGSILAPYLEINPIAISLILGAFLSLSKPIGGLIFGFVFWNISRSVSYEKNIKTFMVISGWGVFLIFAANQALTQVINPYPPFGLVTVSALSMAAYFMLVGIYNSAVLVSANTNLRKSIYNHALESKLLNMLGQSEYEKEIQRTVGKIMKDKPTLEMDAKTEYELDEHELKRYLDIVLREVKKGEKIS